MDSPLAGALVGSLSAYDSPAMRAAHIWKSAMGPRTCETWLTIRNNYCTAHTFIRTSTARMRLLVGQPGVLLPLPLEDDGQRLVARQQLLI